MQPENSAPRVAIACGGTGGHLFPGVSVAREFLRRGCAVTLLISPKEVDQTAVKNTSGMNIVTLPAVGLTRGSQFSFARGFAQSYRASAKLFKAERPSAVLAMGGFTSAPPVLAGRMRGLPTFLHESNAIPGRANRWLSWIVNRAFIGIPDAAKRLHTRNVKVTGTPVRPEFQAADPSVCRQSLGLDPQRPVLLVTGGSQGAKGLNDLVIAALPHLAKFLPKLQVVHLAGVNDVEKVTQAYRANKLDAIVHSFFTEMPTALGAASVVISRAGASSLAELAALRLPSILVPLPTAADNHQYCNAVAFRDTGAASLMTQRETSPEALADRVVELIENASARDQMRVALAKWSFPNAAGEIAESILQAITARGRVTGRSNRAETNELKNRQTAIT